MADTKAIKPIATEGSEITVQGYATGITEAASAWLATQMESGEFKVPEGYDIKGECSSAMVKLMNTKVKVNDNGKYSEVDLLSTVSRDSVIMFLKDMVAQGLSFTRSQCYAVPRGGELTLNRSYFGTISSLSVMFPRYEVSANVIYDGDEYDYCTDSLLGFNYVDNHKSSLLNRDNPIVAAYGNIYDRETRERVYGCVMSRKEIDVSWSHAKTDKVQKEFPQEMAKRTIINRMCKLFINSKPSGITATQFEAYNRSTENEYDNEPQRATDGSRKPSLDKGGRKFDRLTEEAVKKAENVPSEFNKEEIPF